MLRPSRARAGQRHVPAASLLDSRIHAFVPLAEAQAKYSAAGMEKSKKVIADCGGGSSVTIDLFLLPQLGYEQLTRYEALLGEWPRDESPPVETV